MFTCSGPHSQDSPFPFSSVNCCQIPPSKSPLHPDTQLKINSLVKLCWINNIPITHSNTSRSWILMDYGHCNPSSFYFRVVMHIFTPYFLWIFLTIIHNIFVFFSFFSHGEFIVKDWNDIHQITLWECRMVLIYTVDYKITFFTFSKCRRVNWVGWQKWGEKLTLTLTFFKIWHWHSASKSTLEKLIGIFINSIL